MNMKKSFAAFLSVVLLLFAVFPTTNFSAEETPEAFSGSRIITYTVDNSDVDNFVNGGRAELDLAMRKTMPDWITYRLSSVERNVVLSLQFDFSSYEDYCHKLADLLTYTPSVLYMQQDDRVYMIESHLTSELLNRMNATMQVMGNSGEKALSEIFRTSHNEIVLNGVSYLSEERVFISPEDNVRFKFDALDVTTVCETETSYKRTIVAEVDLTLPGFEKRAKKGFSEAGTFTSEEISEDRVRMTTEITAKSHDELTRKTMIALNAANSVTEKQSYANDKEVHVERTEFFDLERLMKENARFQYSYTYASDVKNLATENTDIRMNEYTVTATNLSTIVTTFDRQFRFASLEIVTDVSNVLGKINRKFIFSVPGEIADAYHEVLKNEFQSKLKRGYALNIYNLNTTRCFELTFTSFSENDILAFTKDILDSKGELEYHSSWVPFGASTITDEIAHVNTVGYLGRIETVRVSYVLPKGAMLSKKNADSFVQNGTKYTCSVEDEVHMEVQFRTVYLIKTILEILAICAVAIPILVFFKRRKRKKKKAS